MQEQAREGLRDEVLPRVKAAPGFVAGYWFAPDGDRGSSVVFWDTKEAADAMAAQLQPGAHPAPPVTVEQVDVVEVIAHI
jgi:heme-degrading monooxygenase HmoA